MWQLEAYSTEICHNELHLLGKILLKKILKCMK